MPHSMSKVDDELNIVVAVRCRGRNQREIKSKSSVVVSVPDVTGSNEISINTSEDVGIAGQMNAKTYTVDKVFGPSANQKLIFEKIADPLFDDFLRGYNCTVLVYGMTSTGKTYTMTGDEKLYSGELSDSAGIIPRILFKLFDSLDSQKQNKYIIKCSFIELYNEELKDLLVDTSLARNESKKLRIFDSLAKSNVQTVNTASIYIQNLKEFEILNAKKGIELLQKGLKHRQVASTKMNDFSSRSHTIFTINLYKKHNNELIRISKMNLVDLAGSENISRSGAQNQRAKEAGSINQSLLTLGRVINSLADKKIHIPFRESKLTRLLQDSLGGNTKTALIATISPAKLNSDETCSTLEYAAKAKSIKNKPQLGSMILKDISVRNISSELAKVKSDLASTKNKNGIHMSQTQYKELTNDLENIKTELKEYKRLIKNLNSQNLMLLNDKKASHEVNELQKLKMDTMRNSFIELQNCLETQHRKEEKMVKSIFELKNSSFEMQKLLKLYSEKEKVAQQKMKKLFDNELNNFKSKLSENIDQFYDNLNEENIDVNTNITQIKSEILLCLEAAQTQSNELYTNFVNNLSNKLPSILKNLDIELENISSLTNEYNINLNKNLNEISKEYSIFKSYLDKQFFKTDHKELIDEQINSAYSSIARNSEEAVQKFKDSLQTTLDENKNSIIASLKQTTAKVIDSELKAFAPERERWELSLDIINDCDLQKNAFYENITKSVLGMNSTSMLSSELLKKSVSELQKYVNNEVSSTTDANNDSSLRKSYQSIKEKNQNLEKILQEIVEATGSSITAFDFLVNSMKFAFDTYSASHSEKNTNVMTESKSAKNFGGLPLKSLKLNEKSNKTKSLSPIKIAAFEGNLKRERSFENANTNLQKSQRIE